MKLSWVAILMATTALSADPAIQIAGKWTVDFQGPGEQPKTVGSIILDLKVDGRAVSGLVTPTQRRFVHIAAKRAYPANNDARAGITRLKSWS